MNLAFDNGVEKEFPEGSQVFSILKSVFNEEELKDVLGIRVGDELFDTQTSIYVSGKVKLVKLKDDTQDSRHFYRHSFSHVLAQAVKRLYPTAKLGIGPAIENGFYYDFDVETPFTPDDLEKITAEMQKIVKENHKFERFEVSEDEARKLLKDLNDPYKLELFEEFAGRGEKISFYKDGDFTDLCRGPHVRFTNQVKYFKLVDFAGAYWRGDEKRKMMQRIYGTAFLKKEDLEEYLWQIEEAKKRDHRKLGKELDLFSTNPDTVGGGLVLWHPKGGLVRHLIEEHCKDQHLKGGYDFVYTPHIGKSCLWETSGHLGFYKDSMYAPIEIDGQEYYLKPMNCPFHVQIFKSSVRSYRDLPLRFAEWGTVYRFERSGVLHGLTRVRGFTQDDAHLFCRPDQMPAEIDKVLDFCLTLLRSFGFKDYKLLLSTRPEKRVGTEDLWDAAENALRAALERSGLPFSINEGDGAFYGPKIDVQLQDALKRSWQLSTVQFDFNLPERFDLHFIGEDGKEHRPYMVHRALLGSMERFFGLLIENHSGAFPLWLSPVQVSVLPISEKYLAYAEQVLAELKHNNIRSELEASNNTLNYRIRHAQNMKIPYMLVVGEREQQDNTVSIRVRNGEDLGIKPTSEFIEFAKNKIATKDFI
ncbi:MAG: threonine--tRNA ligase [Proteobacteria bacterium]|nr:threonine--tRNA ligase [Pseudomonadota bacterium]